MSTDDPTGKDSETPADYPRDAVPGETDLPGEEQPGQPNVGRASRIMVQAIFASRLLAVARDSILAARFGRNSTTDAYVLAFQIPDLLFFLIAGGALSSAFIPVFSEYLHTNRRKEAWHIFSAVTSIMSVIILSLILVVFVFANQLMPIMFDQKQSANYALIATMSRIVLPAQFAFFIGGLMFGTLYANQRFAIPGLAPSVYNLGIIVGALVISQFVSPGIVGMSIGALVGAFIGNFIIPSLEMRKIGGTFSFSLDTKHEGVRKVFRLMLPVVLGLSLPGVYAMIMRSFASGYPDGIVTSLDLSNKLMQTPLGIFGQSFAIAIFPALSQFFAQNRMDAFRDQIVKTMRTAIYVSVPIAIFLGVMAPDVITALFGYGRFKQSDPSSVIIALELFSLGIPAWCLHPILMRGYFAMHQSVKPIVIGTITTALFALLCFTLPHTGLDWRAFPLASSIAAVFLAIILGASLAKDCGGFNIDELMSGLVKSVAAGAVFGAAVWGLSLVLPHGSEGVKQNLFAFGRLGVAALVGGWVYYFITKWFRMPESERITRALSKLDRRSSRSN